jgi:hypothetical protein
MRATEFIIEYRNRLLQYVKSLLPTWPEYVLKDWLVPNKGNFSNLPTDAIKNGIMEKVQGAGLTANSKWQLIPDMKFSMDMFEPKTKQRLIGRAGGSSDLGMGIPKDKERHATQAALAQQQGGIRSEPVILIKRPDGYELLEGWHRTIQHFHKFPDGYTGPAYIAVSRGQQGVAEGYLNEFAPVGGDNREPDEEELLRQLASMWWLGTEQQMIKAQKTLAAMGWEIGQDESGDDDAGVFVIRVGDVNGDSYMAFPHSELNLNEGLSKGT